MFGIVCSQCKKTSNGAANRLVRDSCGHEKCRMCLLLDEENCRQCKINNTPVQCKVEVNDYEQHSVIKFENHTGVITCNGTPKKPEIIPVVENGIGETKSNEIKPPTVEKSKTKSNKLKKDSQNKRLHRTITIPSHVTILKDPTFYKCNICNKQFSTKSHIKYHIYCTGRKLVLYRVTLIDMQIFFSPLLYLCYACFLYFFIKKPPTPQFRSKYNWQHCSEFDMD